MSWWRDGVLYQIYPRSFADSNGDGVGDLRGIVDRLEYLAWLGIDGIWLNPTMPSPNADWGYDVSDYLGVHPELGTLADLDDLVAAAGSHGIRILLDLVPNHTSDRHPWFVESRSSRDSERRDWYVWADPRPDGSPPNNWVSVFGGPAWTLDETTGQYYLHLFLVEQPDLNWWNEGVHAAFEDILRYWFDRGIAGFRIDVANALYNDRELRDNPPATPDDDERLQRFGQRFIYNANRPETHDVYRAWRAVADSYEAPRILMGETYVTDLERLATFYGTGSDGLHLAQNFVFATARLDAARLREIVAATEAALPDEAWPVWFGSNHDFARFPTRWCGDDEAAVRCALLILLTLRGTPILYYGDELGMPEAVLSHEQLRDPVGLRGWPDEPGRDGARTPMPWSDEPGAGFTTPTATPWLPYGDLSRNVRAQRDDPGSTLVFVRDLVALRRELGDLRRAPYEALETPPGTWAWRRGRALVVVNLSPDAATVAGIDGSVAIATRRERDGERLSGTVALGPYEGVVVLS